VLQTRDVWELRPTILVILNEVKNHYPHVLAVGNAKARGCARDEILHFVQNDKDGEFVTLYLMPHVATDLTVKRI
jgi:hypothetical protein